MDYLAMLWARRMKEKLERAETQQLAREVSELQNKMAPKIAEARKQRRERMRQDGEYGFVMKEPTP